MGKRNNHHRFEIRKEIRQKQQPPEFRINKLPPKEETDLKPIVELLRKIISTSEPKRQEPPAQLIEILHILADLTTGIWRARQKMLIPDTDQVDENMRKVFRPLDAAYQQLIQSGVKIEDRIRQPFITGMAEKVIAYEPADGIARETIIETIKPTIQFRGQLLQQGEIIVGTPIHNTTKE